MRMAIAGATGTVGRHVHRVATDRGHEVVPLSRRHGHDLTRGDVADALTGVKTIIDVTGIQTFSRRRATTFFEAASRTIQASGTAARVPHLVALSIVGIDGVDSSYYGAKLAHERAVESGDLPFTLVRAAQFHEFAAQTVARGSFGRITMTPTALLRPVAAREVAEYLVDVAESDPRGRAPDLVGPRDETLIDMVASLLDHTRSKCVAWEIPLPGAMGAAMASGRLRGTTDARRGRVTFSDWLRDQHHDSPMNTHGRRPDADT